MSASWHSSWLIGVEVLQQNPQLLFRAIPFPFYQELKAATMQLAIKNVLHQAGPPLMTMGEEGMRME